MRRYFRWRSRGTVVQTSKLAETAAETTAAETTAAETTAAETTAALNETEQAELYIRTLRLAFMSKQPEPISWVLAKAYGLEQSSILFDLEVKYNPTCFELVIDSGHLILRFSAIETGEQSTFLVADRWWSILPLVQRLVQACGSQRVRTIFNLNDEGLNDGLSFCDNRASFSLIPDPVYVSLQGYAHVRDLYKLRAVSWENKADIVFWRGTSTGRPFGKSHELPRITLCKLCRRSELSGFDVGLTSLVDLLAGKRDDAQLQSLTAPYVPWHEFDLYRYHIDIDGHTNSWPGLMYKLHSGGLVFKVDSPENYRQWYYERLRPWENYVPVKSDLSDLLDLVAYFRRNESIGRSIAAEGLRLAQTMDFETELDVGVRTIMGRSNREEYLSHIRE